MPNQSLSSAEVQKVWEQARQELKLQLSSAAFNTWVLTNPLTEVEIYDQHKAKGIISTPTAFHATNLKKNLFSQLKSAIEKALNKQVELDFKVQDPAELIAKQKQMTLSQKQREGKKSQTSAFSQLRQASSSNQNFNQATSANRPDGTSSPRVEELFSENNIQAMSQDRALTAAKRAGLRLDYKFKTFAVSGSNEMAHAAATAVSKNPGQAYNPLFLYGGVGVGKTHLMHAIGHSILQRDPSISLIYCTGEEFTNEIINAIRSKDAIKFKKKYRNARVLLIDDIQFIAGKNTVQEEFFHTFNALTKMSSQIVLTSDRPPHEIKPLEDRLKSRFEAGLMVDIQQPSLELRTAIVLIKARASSISLPINLAEIIAQNVDSARKIEGIITTIRSEFELKNKEIDADLINTIIAKEKSNHGGFKIKLRPQKLIKKVCNYYQLKQSSVKGKSRTKDLVHARHMAMYLLKADLDMSYVEIGKWFSNRDHTSVMHAKDKIENLLDSNEDVLREYEELKSSLIKISA